MVALANVIPPMGWSSFDQLAGRLPRGGSAGGASDISSHGHAVNDNTGASSSATAVELHNPTEPGTGMSPGHTHSFNESTSTADNLPPYLTVLFVQRNVSEITAAMADEIACMHSSFDP